MTIELARELGPRMLSEGLLPSEFVDLLDLCDGNNDASRYLGSLGLRTERRIMCFCGADTIRTLTHDVAWGDKVVIVPSRILLPSTQRCCT